MNEFKTVRPAAYGYVPVGLTPEEKAPALAQYNARKARIDQTNPKDTVGQNVLRTLPSSSEERKQRPITTGVLDYFPLALAEVARCSKAGNDQHNAGQPLHWARGKSEDHADCIVRHLIERGTVDSDGVRHSAKVAWRALAMLQTELEQAAQWQPKERA